MGLGSMYRIGLGYDIHRLVPERRLILGGVDIPWDRGLLGHSDADVLVHAVTDAVLGAVAAGDIGQWFPDDDDRWLGAHSLDLLATVLRSSQLVDWGLVNLDAVVIAEAPKLRPFISAMRTNLAGIFGVAVDRISVKATTSEGLGCTGRGEALAAQATVLLEKRAEGNVG